MHDFNLDFEELISLRDIYESGQCFRWTDLGNHSYRIIAGMHLADVTQISPTEIGIREYSAESRKFWADYFDKDASYRKMRERIPASDGYLRRAAHDGAGIRILRQDPWEMIVTFIISQRKNIPAIRTCVEKLSHVAGKKIPVVKGTKTGGCTQVPDSFDRFPAPEEISSIFCRKVRRLSEEDSALCTFQKAGYANCSLGYRMPYVQDAARWAEEQDLDHLRSLSDSELLTSLLKIKGVGSKVASCIMLFGFHRLDAFPVDVWMKRVLADHYPDGFPAEKYAGCAGVMQQYLFFEIRHKFS